LINMRLVMTWEIKKTVLISTKYWIEKKREYKVSEYNLHGKINFNPKYNANKKRFDTIRLAFVLVS